MIKYFITEVRMLKNIFVLVLTISIVFVSNAKELDLKYVQQKAMSTSPLTKQRNYYQTISDLEKKSTRTVYLPQFTIDAQGTYQSDVFELPFKLSIVTIPVVPKDQYKVTLNVNQMIWDGGVASFNSDKSNIDLSVNNQQTEVNLFKVKEAVNQIYFNILFVQENLRILEIVKSQLDSNRYIIESAVKNGVMLKSNLQSIEIEIIRTEQKISEITSDRKALLKMLSMWIEEELTNDVVLNVPDELQKNTDLMNRPEYPYFELKKKQLDNGKDLISSILNPKFFAFGQGSYGSPNQLNMFETTGSFFYIVGLKMQWTPFDWFNNSRKQEILEINKSFVNIEKENFDKNLKISLIKDSEDIEKYNMLITRDEDISSRQKLIVAEYFSKLKNNTITITDFLNQFNQQTQTEISLKLHKLQKLNALINLLTKSGNY